MRRLIPSLMATMLFAAVHAMAAQFTLNWTDNSTNEDGFTVERATGSGAFVQIASVPANTVTYVDIGLPASTTFSYRVRAFNAAGTSAYSNVATGTTPDPNVPATPGTLTIPGRVVNISTRTDSISASSPVNGGFVIIDGPVQVLIRGVGPTLAAPPFNLNNACTDVKFTVMQGQTVVASNDDWSGQDVIDAAVKFGAFPLTPGSKDAALVITLPPGSYTVPVVPSGTATGGIAMVEIYWK